MLEPSLDQNISKGHYSQQLVQPVHPLKIWQDKDWLIPKHTIQTGGLEVEHHLEAPDTVEVPPVTHHMLLLHLNDGPRQVARFAGEEYDAPLSSGAIFLLPTKMSGFFHWESEDEVLMFAICPHRLRQIATQTHCLNPDRVELKPTLPRFDPQLERIGRAFIAEMETRGLGGQLYCELLANLLMVHLLRSYCTTDARLKTYHKGLGSQRLQIALNYINDHLDRNIGLDSIATELGMSSYYFCRLFRQSMGIAPYQYLLQQRVERAKQLLRHQPHRPIVDIALDCGVASQSHLNRHFRKLTGMTPYRYRNGD